MLRGIGTSRGIGIGKVLVITDPVIEVEFTHVSDIEAEKKKFVDIRKQFIDETEKLILELQEKLGKDSKDSLVLKNQVYLAKDSALESEVNTRIEQNSICVEAAIDEATNVFVKLFSSMPSEDMKQRVVDILDMKNRMLQIHRGVEQIDLTHLQKGTVIVAEQINPSMTAAMDIESVVGIVAEKGGETSHASILARALEIPAVLSVKGVVSMVKNGDSIIVDGAYGEVFINPSSRTEGIYQKKKAKFDEQILALKEYINKSTLTADGVSVGLAANIGSAQEAARAQKDGAEGVGLFRTEFLFMNGISMPTEEQQFAEYKKAAVLLKGKPLTIRTLDIGGDKDIPYMGLAKENNPFLGYRAIRFCLDRVDIFTTQLRAILRASAFGNIRIMIPMITCVNELMQVKEIVRKIEKDLDKHEIAYDKEIKIGVMIETPAAAVMADVLAKEADFFSIGTNDLTQYTVAVDRCNENVSYLYSIFNPAVLRLIKHIIECGHRENIEVGMCGEAAGNMLMIPLLLSMGLDEFSVTASKVLETRKEIAGWSMKEAKTVTDHAMILSTPREVSEYLSDYMAERK